MADNRNIFISYSWSSPQFEDWVVQLAMRLVTDGVDVILDKWALKEGHDKYHFMETMVTAPNVEKVLIILDKKYAERADERRGGVGTETMIISPQLYANSVQEKFIPIVAEVDDNGHAFLPAYLKGRIYIDLSSKDHFEANYEKLLRSIYNRPSLSKPKLGTPPKYLFEESPAHYKTTTLSRSLDGQLDKNPSRINSLIRDFVDNYFNDLKEFVLEEKPRRTYDEIGEAAFNLLNQYKSLKGDYISFLTKIIKSDISFDQDIILHFFERLPLLFSPMDDNVSSWSRSTYDHFRLIVHELFLYTVGIALQYANYELLRNIFHSGYLIKERHSRSTGFEIFTAFRYNYDLMDQYYNKLHNTKFYSVQADYIIKNMPDELDRDLLTDADLLCYYVAKLNDWNWFPITYVYKVRHSDRLDIISRLVSKKHFEKIKGMLGFENVQNLKEKVTELDSEDDRGYSSGFERIPKFTQFIKIEQIGIRL